jgi:pimeloyl-ACP methyl ester carboxylesterase
MQRLVDVFIRHPRALYSLEDLGHAKQRTDALVPLSPEGHELHSSFFFLSEMPKVMVVYCHGSAGSRLDGVTDCFAIASAYSGIGLGVFDFTGAGHSAGEYIALGAREWKDVLAELKYIKDKLGIDKILLWGRSMGAVACLMLLCRLDQVQDEDIEILGAILDSPFSELKNVINQVLEKRSLRFVRGITSLTIPLIRKHILEKVPELDITEWNVAEMISKSDSQAPVLFVHGKDDDFVLPSESKSIYDAYPGKNKDYFLGEGGHNGPRTPDILERCSRFVFDILGKSTCVDKPLTFVPVHLACTFVVQVLHAEPEDDCEHDPKEDTLKKEDEDEHEALHKSSVRSYPSILLLDPEVGILEIQPFTGKVLHQYAYIDIEGFGVLKPRNILFLSCRNSSKTRLFGCSQANEVDSTFHGNLELFLQKRAQETSQEQILNNLGPAVDELFNSYIRHGQEVDPIAVETSLLETLKELVPSTEGIETMLRDVITKAYRERFRTEPEWVTHDKKHHKKCSIC